MNKHTMLRVGLLLLIVAAVAVIPAMAQQAYFEDFEDGEAQGWESEGDWFIDDGFLIGEGGGGFFFYGDEFSDVFFDFELIDISGELLVFPSVGNGPAPAVGLTGSQSSIFVVMYEDAFGANRPVARGSYDDYPAWREETGDAPLPVSLVYEGGFLEVIIGEQSITGAEYTERPPSGTLGFVLRDAFVIIDNVYIEPRGSTGGTETQQGGADVRPSAIQVVDAEIISQEETVLEVDVTLVNDGEAEAEPGFLVLYSVSSGDIEIGRQFPSLAPGERNIQTFSFSTFGLGGEDLVLAAQIEVPGDTVIDNNYYEARAYRVPTFLGEDVLQPGPEPGVPTLGLIMGGGVAAMLAIAGVFGGLIIGRTRRFRLQREARPRHPEGDCSRRDTEVEVETEIELKPSHVTVVRLYATDPNSGEDVASQEFKNRSLNRALTSAIHAAALRTSRENWQEHVEKAAEELASGMIAFGKKQGKVLDVTAVAHIEGIEVKQTYTLYRCRGQQWQKGATWNAKKTQNRDDDLLHVSFLDPEGTSLARRLTADLEAMLYTYLESLTE